ncbi:MAG: hypothetical protein ABIR50_11330 [Ginsengibacter sp.]
MPESFLFLVYSKPINITNLSSPEFIVWYEGKVANLRDVLTNRSALMKGWQP